jgi:hypothetical protein
MLLQIQVCIAPAIATKTVIEQVLLTCLLTRGAISANQPLFLDEEVILVVSTT